MTNLETYKYIEPKIYCPISYMLIQSTYFSLYSIFISTTYTSPSCLMLMRTMRSVTFKSLDGVSQTNHSNDNQVGLLW